MHIKKLVKQIRFDFGQRVYYKSKIGKDEGIVTGVSFRPNGISYAVVWSNKEEKWHYEIELEATT